MRSNNKEWFALPADQCWNLLTENLFFISKAFGIKIQAFVLLSNHFHLLFRTPQGNYSETMHYFLRETARDFNRISGRINHVFGSRNKPTLITTEPDYARVLKYIYRNPAKAKLCSLVEEYPFSTLYGLLGQGRLIVPIEDPNNGLNSFIPDCTTELLNWLNEPFTVEQELGIGKALRKSVFKVSAKSTSRTKIKFDGPCK